MLLSPFSFCLHFRSFQKQFNLLKMFLSIFERSESHASHETIVLRDGKIKPEQSSKNPLKSAK